jgi:CPA2 family monovalent cation:H+ antiporter-2
MGPVITSIHERRAEFRKELNQPEALGGRSGRFRDAQSSAAAEKN